MSSVSKSKLFTPVSLGSLKLKNRLLMAPMTRARSTQPGDVPNAMMAKYYSQRASAGLIVTEGTQISTLGKGYAQTPGIYSAEQVDGWKLVTDAVHAKGGVIFSQLWHVGRVSHPENTGGEQPISCSPKAAKGVKVYIINESEGPHSKYTTEPREMQHEDFAMVLGQYRQAAKNALDAGFDGVELHAANGYLVNQFIDSGSNDRTDEYGGSLENRLRFLGDVVSVLIDVVGKDRVGVRLAPLTTLNGTVDDNPQVTYEAAAKLLNDLGVAYMHIAEVDWEDAPETPVSFKKALRAAYKGTLVFTGNYNLDKATSAVEEGIADMIGFGRLFLANPDLPARLQNDHPLNKPDSSTFYGGGDKGYTDYPVAEQLIQAFA